MENQKDEKAFNNETFVGEYEYKVNGLRFKIKPIYLYELMDFENDRIPTAAGFKEEPSDGELLLWWLSIFLREEETTKESQQEQSKNIFVKIKTFFEQRKENKTHSKAYASYAIGGKMVSWLEKKVSINGKNIVFHDLENKYRLSKAEIARLYFYFIEISGFPEPLKEGLNKLLKTAKENKTSL